ncbi:kinase-like domain-containing protein [Suillus subalutaceus]|uniref:kinase-like domain-containing protein n=1 Tax=Suillus subalutaceus TaxID=48586 RepID=UPI001B86D384|nr:kinase-like domain-containing protein [Suillus subalutaceus]KAG1877869.1 kinase-like domain-containing protein [Suillus subalutaceus]
MLVQGIALVRVGQYFMSSTDKLFVVAIYLRASLTVERYIIAQPGEDRKVFIAQKDFDLGKAEEEVAFLREMYNLAEELDNLAGKLDPKNEKCLGNIKNAALKSPRNIVKSSGAQDDLGIFDADDIQCILKEMDYNISFILFGHPFLALVSNIEDDSQQGYLKFVKEGQKEIEILRYLTGIESPSNYTISPVQIWPVQGGCSKLLTSCIQHGVVHLDLKPPNILLPADGGRLSIIDFNRSVHVKGTEHMFHGVVGTTGYLAPEVAAGQGLYSAIHADLWSCGKTLEELCSLSRELMNEDPKQRPMMSDVLKRLVYYEVDANTGPGYFR